MSTSFDFLSGEVLLIDKPLKWTSFDVVNKIRYTVKRYEGVKKLKVGHAGTLDPLATGLLLVCTGKKTKTINELMGQVKTYTGIITLGGTTPSYDLETTIENQTRVDLKEEEIMNGTRPFLGDILQTPPAHSAKKIDGKKAYELARKGKEVELKKNAIHISKFDIIDISNSPLVDGGIDCSFEITCSKGTYIRSIAHDLGANLGCGGFLSQLRRTKIGDYSVDQAFQIDTFCNLLDQENS